jgi:DNA polymerase-3 subunit epsilon
MRTALFYDTETSGLPLFNDPSDDPRQPHIVQLGACLVDLDTRAELASLDVICRPDGWVIPDEVANVHGITTERAKLLGISELIALHLFVELWACADVRIAHNEQFDARILRIALKRNQHEVLPHHDAWAAGAAECTAKLSTPILKLPPTPKMRAAGRFHHKTPNLGEAFKHFTGNDLVGAHSAMVDVRARMAVYFAIKAPQPQAA